MFLSLFVGSFRFHRVYPDRDLMLKLFPGIGFNGVSLGGVRTDTPIGGPPSSMGPCRAESRQGYPGRAMILSAPPKADGSTKGP